MMYLLDTNVLLWYLSDDASLRKDIKDLISNPSNSIYVSTVSSWEISIKQALGKLEAPDTLKEAILATRFDLLPISLDHTLAAKDLPNHHFDPFDQLLIAQAQVEKLVFITHDDRIPQYPIKCLKA